MKDIRLTLVQMRSTVGDAAGNLGRMESFVRDNPDSDIVCFPEMCLSGYTTDSPGRFALSPDDTMVGRARDLSEETGTALVFGYLENNGERPFLRQEIVDRGDPQFYRKAHLGRTESAVFAPGDSLPVFDVGGVRIGIQLCVESHIPDICSTLRAKGAELVLTPSANGITGEKRKSVWYSYLPARASDNGMFVAACSAVGDNGLGTVFGGGMIALNPKGGTIAEHYGNGECSITVDIGGRLPRDGPETMANISYYDRRRPELYRRSRSLGTVVDASVDEFLQHLEPLSMDVVDVVRPVHTAVDQSRPEKSSDGLVGPLRTHAEKAVGERRADLRLHETLQNLKRIGVVEHRDDVQQRVRRYRGQHGPARTDVPAHLRLRFVFHDSSTREQ
jgi:predicted amidohydrolase